jgi:hypothetical protein
MAQLDYVARKMRLRRFRYGRSGPAVQPAAEEFARTEGPMFIPMKHVSATLDASGAVDRLLAVPQFPNRLPGSFFGVVLVGHPANPQGLPAEGEYRSFRASAVRRGLKVLAIELPDDRGMHRLADGDADLLVRVSRSTGGSPPDKAAMLALALAELPEDCDKIAWLDAARG